MQRNIFYAQYESAFGLESPCLVLNYTEFQHVSDDCRQAAFRQCERDRSSQIPKCQDEALLIAPADKGSQSPAMRWLCFPHVLWQTDVRQRQTGMITPIACHMWNTDFRENRLH
jgi:hypothetical protein